MSGRFYIDGVDAVSVYGVSLTSYEGLIQFPPLKPIEFNDWPDENGIEPDLAEPALDAKEFSLAFSCTGNIKLFISALKDGSYHTFNFTEIGLVKTLRLIAQSDYKNIRTLHAFSLTFSDDFPLEGYSYLPANLSGISDGFSIDGTDLSQYGLRVLRGTLNEINKEPEIKKNLAISTVGSQGLQYDGDNIYHRQKNVSIKLFYNGGIDNFWRNYNALLYDLSQPGERVLLYGSTLTSRFYYQSCEVERFAILNNGNVWCSFSINVCFTMQDPKVIYLLTTEDDKCIETEDGNYLIELA